MTLGLAIVVSLLILVSSPIIGLSAYSIAVMWYPYNNTVALGSIDFSVGRIAILSLFLKIIINGKLFNLKLNSADKMVFIFFIGQIIAGSQTTPFAKLVENRAGDFFDKALPYFAARTIITSKYSLIKYSKIIAISTACLGCFAFFESLTGKNLLAFGRSHMFFGKRMGLFRARATFNHPIYMGVFFGMLGTFFSFLPAILKNKLFWSSIVILCYLGSFASLSSGGLMTMMLGLIVIFFYKYRYCWKTIIKTIVIMIIFTELLSNRHFYNVIDRFTFNAQTAWYRTRLFEVAFFENGMTGHWLCGYGFDDPMWCLKIDGRKHTDMVNHFLLVLSRNGLLGCIPFLILIFNCIKNNYNKLFLQTDIDFAVINWAVGASILAVIASMNSVSLFGQPMTFFFIILAITNISQNKYLK